MRALTIETKPRKRELGSFFVSMLKSTSRNVPKNVVVNPVRCVGHRITVYELRCDGGAVESYRDEMYAVVPFS